MKNLISTAQKYKNNCELSNDTQLFLIIQQSNEHTFILFKVHSKRPRQGTMFSFATKLYLNDESSINMTNVISKIKWKYSNNIYKHKSIGLLIIQNEWFNLGFCQ